MVAIPWKTIEQLHYRIDTMTPFSERDHEIIRKMRYVLIEYADLKIRHEKLQKQVREKKKK